LFREKAFKKIEKALIRKSLNFLLRFLPVSAVDDESEDCEERIGQDEHHEYAVSEAVCDQSPLGRLFESGAAHGATLSKGGRLQCARDE
jgi:hypothetical protein